VGDAVDGFGNPLRELLDPGDGRRLLACPVDWSGPAPGWPKRTRLCLTWWAADRPFVWLDDEITDTDQHWVAANHPKPRLLHHVDPNRGLTEHDLAAVRRWLEQPDDTR
jgi:hypothetical protein